MVIHVEVRGATVRLDIEVPEGLSLHGIFEVAGGVSEKDFEKLPKLYEYNYEAE